jgi:hypothetical protein
MQVSGRFSPGLYKFCPEKRKKLVNNFSSYNMRTAARKDCMIFCLDTEALGCDYFCLLLLFTAFTIIPLIPVTRISFIHHQRSKVLKFKVSLNTNFPWSRKSASLWGYLDVESKVKVPGNMSVLTVTFSGHRMQNGSFSVTSELCGSKKYTIFMTTRKFITLFEIGRYRSETWARWFQSTSSDRIYLKHFINILTFMSACYKWSFAAGFTREFLDSHVSARTLLTFIRISQR